MSLNLKNKLYQMFILGVRYLPQKFGLDTMVSENLAPEFVEILQQGLGGVIFFTDDIHSEKQFKSIIRQINKHSVLIPPFLSIDQEGGRVERTQNIHGGKKYLSAKYAFEKGEQFLKQQTEQIALELCLYGINLNFAPCIDVNTNPQNPIIGERAFSSVPEEVIACERIVSETYRQNNIIPCIKHFPGHGDANADSHLSLPQIDLPLKKMEETHIKPFKYSIQNNADMVMIAHLHCTCFEKDPIPTSLSKNAITYLRKNLGFDGVIISDDMVMKGVAAFGDVEACIMGIKAGLNMFIYRNCDDNVLNMIEKVYQIALSDEELQKKIELSFEKIMQLKQKYKILT